jgi:hypothetical protein
MNAQSVIEDLKAQAERKAALKMFYAAADVFREYQGPFAQETAVERTQLADAYEDRARAAENARWGEGSAPPPRQPVTEISPAAAPRPPPPPRPVRPATSPMLVSKPVAKVEAQLTGTQLTFPCRWCQEPMSTDAANAGKLIPCPKCDLLVTVPKPKK